MLVLRRARGLLLLVAGLVVIGVGLGGSEQPCADQAQQQQANRGLDASEAGALSRS
jgi:hypothetical protein